MDPDVTLDELSEMISLTGEDINSEQWQRVCDLFIALDDWMRKGGYLPRPWTRYRAGGYQPTRSAG